jgi:DNA-binding transcriptional MerR regulator
VDSLMSIGVFARKTRLSMKALRLYDRLGLLEPVHIDQANGYRWYRRSQLATARLIATLRRLDMPLSQVAEVIAAAGPDVEEVERPRQAEAEAEAEAEAVVPRRKAAELVTAYWESVERRLESQRLLAAHLAVRLSGEYGSYRQRFDVREREVAEQTVLSEQRHVLQPELAGWLPDCIGRLYGLAGERFGGAAGPCFVIYHGEVNQDSDGPVEVCVPVRAPNRRSAGTAMRIEPAHREAYARITRAMVEFPQILSAYDAVTEWLNANARSMTASPREIYFADFEAAKPTDEVCDIAFPMR